MEKGKRHIQQFPVEESHYSRSDNPHTQYLSGELSLSAMYRLYQEDCKATNAKPVKEWFYRNVFNTQFNLRFKRPRSDTCKTCEELKIGIETAPEDERQRLKTRLDLHHRKAQAARDAMKADTKHAAEDDATLCISFDLQKTLDTPKLPVGEAYYLCQLNSYNFAVVNNVTLDSTMFVWNEAEGRKGADEVSSCLLKYIESVPATVKHLVFWSDGQNKNHQLQILWMRFSTVEHKFLEVGHTYLPCDRCFGHIERKKRTVNYVFTTDDWAVLIANSRPHKPFTVVQMSSRDFIDIDQSRKAYVCV